MARIEFDPQKVITKETSPSLPQSSQAPEDSHCRGLNSEDGELGEEELDQIQLSSETQI